MTKSEYRYRYNELLRETVRHLRLYGEAALRNGLDLLNDEAPGTTTIPKSVLCAALQDCRDKWTPPGEPGQRSANERKIALIYKQTTL